ncbi:hypothetical protein T484DRAFT_1787461 [Baffinella frigidus]|nr:hypothetical protein T484DRAFT_1787461 [Cryptophyta sp. CCMP2293]
MAVLQNKFQRLCSRYPQQDQTSLPISAERDLLEAIQDLDAKEVQGEETGSLPAAQGGSDSAKANFERAAAEGNINNTFDFAATVLTRASSGSQEDLKELDRLGCLVFALQLPTRQASTQLPTPHRDFNLLSLGEFCVVSASKEVGKKVGKEKSPWRVNFPGQDADESATGFVNGKPVELKFVSGTWELRKKATKRDSATKNNDSATEEIKEDAAAKLKLVEEDEGSAKP